MSAGAFDAGVTVNVYETLQDALEGVTYLVAATARLRGIEKRVTDAVGAAGAAHARTMGGKGVAAVMFGGEKSGLPNEAVALADLLMTYPVNPEFKSLNLAQAVCVFAHEWGKLSAAENPADFPSQSDVKPVASTSGAVSADSPPATRDDVFRMFEHFEEELERAGYFFPAAKTPLMKDNLRAALIRADWTEQEVQTFRGAIKALAIGRGKARVVRED